MIKLLLSSYHTSLWNSKGAYCDDEVACTSWPPLQCSVLTMLVIRLLYMLDIFSISSVCA